MGSPRQGIYRHKQAQCKARHHHQAPAHTTVNNIRRKDIAQKGCHAAYAHHQLEQAATDPYLLLDAMAASASTQSTRHPGASKAQKKKHHLASTSCNSKALLPEGLEPNTTTTTATSTKVFTENKVCPNLPLCENENPETQPATPVVMHPAAVIAITAPQPAEAVLLTSTTGDNSDSAHWVATIANNCSSSLLEEAPPVAAVAAPASMMGPKSGFKAWRWGRAVCAVTERLKKKVVGGCFGASPVKEDWEPVVEAVGWQSEDSSSSSSCAADASMVLVVGTAKTAGGGRVGSWLRKLGSMGSRKDIALCDQ